MSPLPAQTCACLSSNHVSESVAINSSLMTLARCLEVLRYNQQHPGDARVIPYRESKVCHGTWGVGHSLVMLSLHVQGCRDAHRQLAHTARASLLGPLPPLDTHTHTLPRRYAIRSPTSSRTSSTATGAL